MKSSIKEPTKKKKVLTKRLTKKKKVFKDPFLRELNEPKAKKTIATEKVKKDEDETIVSRTASNKANIARLLPKTRLQLPTHALRSARTFAQCPSVSVVSNKPVDVQQRQLPVVCSRAALNFHARRLGNAQRVDNVYRVGQKNKRFAAKMKIDRL